MTHHHVKDAVAGIKQLLGKDEDVIREGLRDYLQGVLESEMTAVLGASKGERTGHRVGYRSRYYDRTLVTRVGPLELRVPQDRDGHFSTSVFERYQRSEKALVAALAEMYVEGVSTRKVKRITEELCGHSFSASTISNIVKRLGGQLAAFSERRLEETFPYLILDARYERVRDSGVIASRAVLIALGVEFVVSDDHAGLRQAITEVLPQAAWQRCYVHFLRNALDHMPRKRDDDCLQELRWLYDRRNLEEARTDLAAWLARWQSRYPKLTAWVEDTIEETFAFYSLPLQHHKHLKSTNMLKRVNQEIKRRTHILRVFPNAPSCLRLVRALAVEIHEDWLEANRYLNMIHLKEHRRERLRKAA